MTRLLLGTLAAAMLMLTASDSYREDVEQWRERREARLKAEGGWLSVAGLRWLHEGRTTFGAGRDNELVLPRGSAPDRVGAFVLRDGIVSVEFEPASGATVSGEAVAGAELRPDASGEADVVEIPPRLTLHVIQRGERLGIRLKDTQAEARVAFAGLEWYPVDETWRKEARFVPYDPPRTLKVPNVIGDVNDSRCPGYVAFEIDGKEVRLEPVAEPEDDEYFFIFRDATAGHGTYGSGRFLYAAAPVDGKMVLDFNKAYSPPCAFTPFATCPLPPRSNWLDVPITAGEKSSVSH